MKKHLLIMFLLLGTKIVLGQPSSLTRPNVSNFMPSPNAAALGIYGSVDLSPFTGLPNIGLNVFSLKQGDIEVNARLSYFAGGVKPESHPGWVGQNWSLNVGAVITRKQNSGIDEVYMSNFTNPDLVAYYYNYGLMNADWSTDQFITNLRPNNSSNGNMADLSPDEFFFTLPNGISGSFFLNELGQWKIKSKQAGKLKITVDVNPAPFVLSNYNDPGWLIRITRLIYNIKITDQDGTQYIFGNSPNAIEFIRSPRNGSFVNYEDVIANSWYLTKIISPKGDIVNFVYERRENQYVQNVTVRAGFNSNFPNFFSNNSSSSMTYSSQMITPSYLTEINSSSFRVEFSISPTIELKYNYISSAFNGYLYNDIDYNVITDNIIKDGVALLYESPPVWYKLNSIAISDHNNNIKEICSFGYNRSLNERLFLKKFSRISTADSETYSHNFEYNPTPLPGYNSLQIDQWGYYNGKTFPNTITGLNKDQILAYLDADANYMEAGSLKKITYPTGGYTTFDYEPNQYSSYLQKTPTAINLINTSGTGGGLRIRKITDNDGNGQEHAKEYFYTSSHLREYLLVY